MSDFKRIDFSSWNLDSLVEVYMKYFEISEKAFRTGQVKEFIMKNIEFQHLFGKSEFLIENQINQNGNPN